MPTLGRAGGRRCCHVWPEGEGQGLRQCSRPPVARNMASFPLWSLSSPLSSRGPTLWPHQDPRGQTAVPTSPSTTPCRACSGIPLLGPRRKEPHARHHRGCRGADRLPMCQNPHSPSVDTELQASHKQTEGHERVAPCVPNHGEHTVSLRKRSGSSQEPGRFPQTPAFQPGPATEPKDRGLSCGRERGGESRVHPAIQRLSRHPRNR